MIKDPMDLIQSTRFDIVMKYLYGVAYANGWRTQFYEDLYKNHIQVWNNFSEYDNDKKQSYEAFKSVFDDLLDEINLNGFDASQSLVPVEDGIYVINGAHRVAACLVYGKQVHCKSGVDLIDGMKNCSWEYFSSLNKFGRLNRCYADRTALEFSKLMKNSRIVILYPTAVNMGKTDQVRELIKASGSLVYEKDVHISKKGAPNLMRELYYKEDWAEENNGAGYSVKASLCFKTKRFFRKMSPAIVFLVEFNSLDVANKLKRDIRSIYNVENHSVHINDTHSETVRLAKCLFNDNSIHFLNNFNGRFYNGFDVLLEEYTRWLNYTGLDGENYCISAGSVLSAYGLKDCKDIDYLHSSPQQYDGNPLIQSHNDYGSDLYHTHRDDIIHNPDNHFYRYGVKFSSLKVVKKLKKSRREPKDFKDIKLINRIV